MKNDYLWFLNCSLMKKIFSFIALTLVLLTSCNDKIDMLGGGQESAVVIGLLDIAESVHYVKVTRTFIGDGIQSSLDIAQIADSSYFDDVEVKIQEVLANGSSGRLFTLHDTIIQNKQDGVFYGPEQKVYVFYTNPSSPLLSDATYKLTVSVDGGRMVVTGETPIVSGITLGSWANQNAYIKLTGSGNELGVFANQSITISNVGTSYRLNGKARFDYREYAIGMTDSTDKSITFNFGEANVQPGFNSQHSFIFMGDIFYQTLKNQIPVSNAVEKRVFLGFNFSITGASRELVDYIDLNKPASSLAQNKPHATNLKVTEGYKVIGVFASRTTINAYKSATGMSPMIQGLDKKSRRELCVGPLTGLLGFCSDHQTDNSSETWGCHN